MDLLVIALVMMKMGRVMTKEEAIKSIRNQFPYIAGDPDPQQDADGKWHLVIREDSYNIVYYPTQMTKQTWIWSPAYKYLKGDW